MSAGEIKSITALQQSIDAKVQEIEHRKIFNLFNMLNKLKFIKSQRVLSNKVKYNRVSV